MIIIIVYQRSAGVSGSPALTGVFTKSPEADHLYEQLPGETEEAASNKRQEKDHDYVNDSFRSQGQSVNEMKKKGTDNDDYYVNDDLFPEEYKIEQAAAAGQTKKDEDYYVNDDLFPNSTTAQAAHSSHSDEGLAGTASTSVVISEK